MLRLIAAVLLLALHPLTAAQNAPPRQVYLNAPGAMEKIRATNAAHYEKIQGIVEGLVQQPHEKAAQWMQISFGARKVKYTAFLLTSEPPQADIAFTLDSTRYYGRITLDRGRAEFLPIRIP